MVIVAGHITVDPEQRESSLAAPLALSKRLAEQMAASTLPSRPTCSTPAASTSLSAGSRKRPSKPSAEAPPATSKARQCSRRR
jgi:hypothetical protein